MKIKRILKKLYHLVEENRCFASLFFGGYQCYKKVRFRECRRNWKKRKPCWQKEELLAKSKLKEIIVAAICDEMTWKNLQKECNVISLTPANWKEVFWKERPDVFFCESAWTGLQEQKECWHGQIYRNHNLLFENRKELFSILKFCNTYQIPTVFWNKEDPTFFHHHRYDFKDTALQFDWIFTTAKECVEKYKALGHRQVDVMMFGFSPYFFHPLECLPKERKAIFAGSWYGEEKERCEALERIFDMVLEQNIPLVIYDRQSGTIKEGRTYPEKYRPYVRKALPFEQLGNEFRHVRYAININTVTESETMFARRVWECMAMNTIIISNESVGMRKLFPKGIWFLGEDMPEEGIEKICDENREQIFRYHTNEKRFTEMFQKIGILQEREKVRILVWKKEERGREEVRQLEGESFIADCVTAKEFLYDVKQSYQYGIWIKEKNEMPDFDIVLAHFCYLPEGCGIRVSRKADFTIIEDAEHENVLYPWEIFEKVFLEKQEKTKKYLLRMEVLSV